MLKTQRFPFKEQKKSLPRKLNKRSSSTDRFKMKSRKTSPHSQRRSNHKSSHNLRKQKKRQVHKYNKSPNFLSKK